MFILLEAWEPPHSLYFDTIYERRRGGEDDQGTDKQSRIIYVYYINSLGEKKLDLLFAMGL
jgi:hypothetical protein